MAEQTKSKKIIQRIVSSTTPEEKRALVMWSDELLSIKVSGDSAVEKARQAIGATAKVLPIKRALNLISKELTPRELTQLTAALLEIKAAPLRTTEKLKRGSVVTYQFTKDLAWANRGLKSRMALAGAVAGAILFGGQGAGIAALGTAIGVPLWVVFGAGAVFLASLYEGLTGKKHKIGTTYEVIEARRNPGDDISIRAEPVSRSNRVNKLTPTELSESASIERIVSLAISPESVRENGKLTEPRSYGVYELPNASGAIQRFRFGNHPVRMRELRLEFGSCRLQHLFRSREDAKAVALVLNAMKPNNSFKPKPLRGSA